MAPEDLARAGRQDSGGDSPSPQNRQVWNGAWIPVDGLAIRKIGGETLIVPVRGRLAQLQNLYALNEVGAFIFERLDGRSARQLRSELAEAFEVAEEDAEEDLVSFLRELREAELIKTRDSSAG